MNVGVVTEDKTEGTAVTVTYRDRYVAFVTEDDLSDERIADFAAYSLWYSTHKPLSEEVRVLREAGANPTAIVQRINRRRGWETRFRNIVRRAFKSLEIQSVG
jgi:hypothetical protein